MSRQTISWKSAPRVIEMDDFLLEIDDLLATIIKGDTGMAVPSGITAKVAVIKTQVEAAHSKVNAMGGTSSSGTVHLAAAIETIPTEDPATIAEIEALLDTIISGQS